MINRRDFVKTGAAAGVLLGLAPSFGCSSKVEASAKVLIVGGGAAGLRNAGYNGGIALIDPAKGSVVARYSVQEKVSGAAAIDNNGNIHFGTEAGFYYIVKRTGTSFELLVKRNLADIIKSDPRYASQYSDLYTAKIWSSVVIGDDGRMYICYTDDDSRAFGGVAVLSYEGCKGPDTSSPWPMMGRNRRHTNNQN